MIFRIYIMNCIFHNSILYSTTISLDMKLVVWCEMGETLHSHPFTIPLQTSSSTTKSWTSTTILIVLFIFSIFVLYALFKFSYILSLILSISYWLLIICKSHNNPCQQRPLVPFHSININFPWTLKTHHSCTTNTPYSFVLSWD